MASAGATIWLAARGQVLLACGTALAAGAVLVLLWIRQARRVAGELPEPSEVRSARDAMRHSDRVLAATGLAAERFLSAERWTDPVPEVLSALGEATGTDRVLLAAEAEPGDDERTSWSWSRAAGTAPVDDLSPEAVSEIWNGSMQREPLFGRVAELPAAMGRLFSRRGAATAAVAPVAVGGKPWGLLAFEADDETREWPPGEVQALRTAAGILGAAVQRQRVQAALAAREADYRQVFEERERIESMKQEFLTTVSHELRTPLTSMLGSLGLIRGSRQAPTPERQQELIDIAERNGERLLRLINDLLDLQRLEAGELRFQYTTVQLGPLLEEAVHDIHGFAELYNVRVLTRCEASNEDVVTDRDRLAQVLYNLLSNGIKFSPGGEAVLLAARAAGDGVELTVHDRGPGIPVQFRSRLFEKFSQAETSAARSRGGSGLGLSISRKLVHGLGGTIDVDSSAEAGTTVTVKLPRWGGPAAELLASMETP